MTRLLIAIGLIATLMFGIPAFAQTCGEADGNGVVTISDIVYMMDYTYAGGPPPPDFDAADFDLFQEWTINDAAMMMAYIFAGGPWPTGNCPPTNAPWQPAVSATYRIRHTAAFPAHRDHMVVDLAFDANQTCTGFQFPLRLRADTTVLQIDSVWYPLAGTDFVYGISIHSAAPSGGLVVIGHLPILYQNGSSPLAKLFVSTAPDTASRILNLEWGEYVPLQAPPGHDTPITPMIATVVNPPVRPTFFGTCCIVAGDANGDGYQSISDAVYLITYYFGGGPAPAGCTKMGDADGNGILTIADAVWIINYIFAGGPEPLCS